MSGLRETTQNHIQLDVSGLKKRENNDKAKYIKNSRANVGGVKKDGMKQVFFGKQIVMNYQPTKFSIIEDTS